MGSSTKTKLATLLDERRMTCADVARLLGVTRGLVGQWRVGIRPIADWHRYRLAKFLGVSEADI